MIQVRSYGRGMIAMLNADERYELGGTHSRTVIAVYYIPRTNRWTAYTVERGGLRTSRTRVPQEIGDAVIAAVKEYQANRMAI